METGATLGSIISKRKFQNVTIWNGDGEPLKRECWKCETGATPVLRCCQRATPRPNRIVFVLAFSSPGSAAVYSLTCGMNIAATAAGMKRKLAYNNASR